MVNSRSNLQTITFEEIEVLSSSYPYHAMLFKVNVLNRKNSGNAPQANVTQCCFKYLSL